MVRSKKGQAAVLGLMIGISIFMCAMIFIQPLKDTIGVARNAANLDCTNTSISDGQKGTCLIVDLLMPYFIGATLALAGAWITVKLVG